MTGIFLLCLHPFTLYALQDSKLDLHRDDTKLHVVTSFAGSLFVTEFLEWRGVETWKATLAGSALVAAASMTKEFAVDKFASGSDLMADGIGIGGGVGAQFTIHFSWTGSDLWIFRPHPVK